jgi:prepilin-type N-terminal cleavage/methylation domain-containing protein
MENKSFTLLELIIVIIVMGILATLAIPGYQRTVEDAKSKVCETNLKALDAALDIYAMEHDRMPASLSELPLEYIKNAYVKIIRAKDAWKIKLAYAFVGWDQSLKDSARAYAGFLLDKIAKGDMTLITCPKAPLGGNSYGLNAQLSGIENQAYQNLPQGTLIIGDCDSPVFHNESTLAKERHKRPGIFSSDGYAVVVARNKRAYESRRDGGLVARLKEKPFENK